MTTPAERISRWSRRFAAASALFLVVWRVGVIVGLSREGEVVLAIFGFIFHMIFAKGYSLIPTYFDRDLRPSVLPMVQFPLTTIGTICLAFGTTDFAEWEGLVGTAGTILWSVGVVVFVGGLYWSIRDNVTGHETATGEHNKDRRRVDRTANLFVPVALGYLLFGSYELLASATMLPTVFDGYRPRGIHLLVAGAATLMVFSIGFRLLPRFFRARPPHRLVVLVLPLGAVAPLGLAWSLPIGRLFPVFATMEAIAMVGYALVIATLFRRSTNLRTGLYAVLLGAISGVVGVGIGLWLSFVGLESTLVAAHLETNLLGFLGLTIIGLAFQFYPPRASEYPGSDDRTAIAAIGAIALGIILANAAVLLETGSTTGTVELVETAGPYATLIGAILYAYLLVGVFASR
ncbi:MAG: hypothetical protein ACOCQ3_00600 [Natronomonas sp.]